LKREEDVMSSTKSLLGEKLNNFFEAAWLELPAEATKLLLGAGDEKSVRNAGWKAYDAWINLANEFVNGVYSNPIIGETTGGMMETALRIRQIGGTMAAALFGNVWPSIGLPNRSEVVALRDELLALREELALYSARVSAAEQPAINEMPETLSTGLRRAQLNGYHTANGNVVRRSGRGTSDVAA
jgi:hypothetical protein